MATFPNTFGGLELNENWTLFSADIVDSGGNRTISSWRLDIITAVPEPINVALGVFGGLFLVGSLCRSERLRKMFVKPETVEAGSREQGAGSGEWGGRWEIRTCNIECPTPNIQQRTAD